MPETNSDIWDPQPWTDSPWIDLMVTHQGIELIAAWRRNDGLCGLCGEPVDLNVLRGRRQPTIDHIVPQARLGSEDRVNLQIAHRGCNSWKGHRL